MLNKPTYAIVTIVARGKIVAMGDNFSKLMFSKLVFFSVRGLIMKVQSNKKCVSIKRTIKVHFPLLWQLRFYLRMK